MSPEKVAKFWSMGMCFLEHSMRAARRQITERRYFAFEHPAGASSWPQQCVEDVAGLPGVEAVTFDQCMLGLTSKVHGIPMRKRTTILTNSPCLAAQLRGHFCDQSHDHQVIQGVEGGVQRSVWAQKYPLGLVSRLVHGSQEQLVADDSEL